MEDVLKRLGIVESHVSELRPQVSAILAVLPHLATKADLAELRSTIKTDIADVRVALTSDIAGVRAALSAGLADVRGELRAGIAAVETRMIKWIVATMTTLAALAFSVAKFVH
jgi:hypothetical protein